MLCLLVPLLHGIKFRPLPDLYGVRTRPMPNFYGVATMPLTPPPALEACLGGSKSDMLRFKWSCLIQTEPKCIPILLMRLPRYCSCLRCPHLDAAPCISIGSNEPIIAVSYSACLKGSFCKRTAVGDPGCFVAGFH